VQLHRDDVHHIYVWHFSSNTQRLKHYNLPDHSTTQLRSDLCISTLCKSHYSKGQLQILLWSIVTVLYSNMEVRSQMSLLSHLENKMFQSDFLKVEQQGLPYTVVSLTQHFTNRKPQSHALPHNHMPCLIVTCPTF